MRALSSDVRFAAWHDDTKVWEEICLTNWLIESKSPHVCVNDLHVDAIGGCNSFVGITKAEQGTRWITRHNNLNSSASHSFSRQAYDLSTTQGSQILVLAELQ